MAKPVSVSRRLVVASVLGSLLAPLTALGCVESWLADQHYTLVGEARSISGTPLYTETLHHTAGPQGGTLNVEYLDPGNTLIATKEVRFNCNPTTPSFELVDLQTDVRQGVRWEKDSVQSFRGEDSKTLTIPGGQSIVDAGFDNAIKISWDALMAGDKVRYSYLFDREKRFLELRLVRAKAPAELSVEAGDNIVFFKIAANNMFLRLFADSIYVGYERETRFLRYYAGPSNLPAMADRKQIVIRYQRAA